MACRGKIVLTAKKIKSTYPAPTYPTKGIPDGQRWRPGAGRTASRKVTIIEGTASTRGYKQLGPRAPADEEVRAPVWDFTPQ